MTIAPELIGVHFDMDAATYHALPGASASQLRILWQSTPAHLKIKQTKPREATAEMIIGTLAHSVILEPDKPLPGIIIQPDEYEPGKKWTRNAKACKDWHAQQEKAGLIALKPEEYDAVFGIASAIAGHELASELLRHGKPEVSLVAFDETNRIVVRARLDFVPNNFGYLCDVKTTADVSPRGFERNAFESGFHIQAALYLSLWNVLTGEMRTGFRFIAVEQHPPHDLNVFDCSAEFIRRGWEDMNGALRTYARCVREDNWPTSPQTLQTLTLPRWADKE
jgi:hypothetical protein